MKIKKIISLIFAVVLINASVFAADYTTNLFNAEKNNKTLQECIDLLFKYVDDFMEIYDEWGDGNMITSKYFYSNEVHYDNYRNEDVEYDVLINRKTFRYEFKGEPVDVMVVHEVGSKNSGISVTNLDGKSLFDAWFTMANEVLFAIHYYEIPGDENSIIVYK